MGGVPSVPRDRTRKLEVISGAYSRTGTVSLSLALEKLLDGPVMHGGTQLIGREDGKPHTFQTLSDSVKLQHSTTCFTH
jgi:hypothetical protein